MGRHFGHFGYGKTLELNCSDLHHCAVMIWSDALIGGRLVYELHENTYLVRLFHFFVPSGRMKLWLVLLGCLSCESSGETPTLVDSFSLGGLEQYSIHEPETRRDSPEIEFNRVREEKRRMMQADSQSFPPPFMGETDEEPDARYDVCNLGTLRLLDQVTVTSSSKIFEAEAVKGLAMSPMTEEDKKVNLDSEKNFDEKNSGSPPRKVPRTSFLGKETYLSPAPSFSRITLYAKTPAEDKEMGSGAANDGIKRVIVKYSNDCWDRSRGKLHSSHPLVDEYLFGSILADVGVAPKTWYLSPPSTLVHLRSPASRYISKNLLEKYDKCVDLKTEVRFLVQERVGVTWSKYFKYLSSKKSAESNLVIESELKIARKAIELVQQAHAAGILHGDIHPGNIAFKNPDLSFEEIVPGESEMVLIDFGMANSLFDPSTMSSVSSLQTLNLLLLSPWQLSRDEPAAPRDDVIRIIDSVARHLNPQLSSEMDKLLKEGRADLVAHKNRMNGVVKVSDYFGVMLSKLRNFKISGPSFMDPKLEKLRADFVAYANYNPRISRSKYSEIDLQLAAAIPVIS